MTKSTHSEGILVIGDTILAEIPLRRQVSSLSDVIHDGLTEVLLGEERGYNRK